LILIYFLKDSQRLISEKLFTISPETINIVSMEVNQANEIVFLHQDSGNLKYFITRMNQDGQVLSSIHLPFDNTQAEGLCVQQDKYFVYGQNIILGINTSGTTFLRAQCLIGANGIAVNSNGDIYMNYIRDSQLKIAVLDSAGVRKKEASYILRRRFCSEPRLMPDGKIVFFVRTANSIYLFNSIN
jgi:hypothetical protein